MKKVRFFNNSSRSRTCANATSEDYFNVNVSMLEKYTGSCHCGIVTFQVTAPRQLPVFDCKYALVQIGILLQKLIYSDCYLLFCVFLVVQSAAKSKESSSWCPHRALTSSPGMNSSQLTRSEHIRRSTPSAPSVALRASSFQGPIRTL